MKTMSEEFYSIIAAICVKDPRYHPEAYEFVMEALSHSQRRFKRVKHVTGGELLEGIKGLLLKKFGPMAMTILNFWGVRTTEDFGNMVLNLVEHKVLSKDAQDNYESFKNAYDLDEVFNKNYRKQLARRLKSMRF